MVSCGEEMKRMSGLAAVSIVSDSSLVSQVMDSWQWTYILYIFSVILL